MEFDRNGFPVPAGFEDENRPSRLRPMRGRYTIVALILIFGFLLGLAAQNKDQILSALASMNRGNAVQEIAIRMQRNLDRGELDKALVDADRLVRMFPREKFPRNVRGLIYGQMKRYSEAVAEFSRILAMDPNDATALNNRAYNRALWRREIAEADRDIEQAIAIAGELATFVDTRAYLHYLHGRHHQALEDLDSIIEGGQLESELNDAGVGEIYFHRALVHEQLGNREKAAADFEMAARKGFKCDEKPMPLEIRPPGRKPPRIDPKNSV